MLKKNKWFNCLDALCSDQIRSDDWVEDLPCSYVIILLRISTILLVFSSFHVVFFFHMVNSNSFFSSMFSLANRNCPTVFWSLSKYGCCRCIL